MSSTLSSFEINGIIGAITLGDSTVISTLGDGTVMVTLVDAIYRTSIGTNFALDFFGCCGFMLLNIVFILSMACNWIYPILNGVLVPGLFNTCINSLGALMACYVVDNPGMIRCCGNNFTTSVFLFLLLFGVYQVHHMQ